MKSKILSVLIVISNISGAFGQNYSRPIGNNWLFARENSPVFYHAKVPGYVHTDLLANKLIDSLYWGINPRKYNFVGDAGWVYKTSFFVSKTDFAYSGKNLVFEGIDTYSDIFLNGNQIHTTDNMFLGYDIDVSNLIKEGDNELIVHIKSPIIEIKEVIKKSTFYNSEHAKADANNFRKFARKAQYQFGWDWACPLIPSGIYRPVKLELWDKIRVGNVHIIQKEIHAKNAKINTEVEVEVNSAGSYEFQVLVNGKIYIKRTENVKAGKSIVSLPFEIKNPRLWWPNGLGEQYLYDISVVILNKGKKVESFSHRTGLRTIEFVNNYDKNGKSYYFKVNGIPVFMKGANYVPIDAMLPSVNEERYRSMILNCKEANMNMLRIWGGGIYENDIFYKLCDEFGILIYHDFMFASSMPPADSSFFENVKKEAVYQVKRLRNYACIALWAGGNETESAWFEGFMPKEYPKEVYYIDHKKIFDELLHSVIAQYQPEVSYVRSSPTTGTDSILVNTPGYGDTHAWSVWFGKIDFDKAEVERMSRFISEYGFVGYPPFSSMQKYLPVYDMDTASAVFKFRDAYIGIQNIIREFLDRYYPQPRSLKDFVYLSGVLQADAMKVSNEIYRRNMPFCMGALLWQLNDVWPVASWSLVDYYGQWKPIMYSTRQTFAPVITSIRQNNDSVFVYVVNDLKANYEGLININVIDFSGNVFFQKSIPVMVQPGTSSIVLMESLYEIIEPGMEDKVFLQVFLENKNIRIAENLHFFARCKDLKLNKAYINIDIKADNSSMIINLKSDKLAKNVFLTDSEGELHFSDNNFDLPPNEQKTIEIKAQLPIEELKSRLSFYSMNELLNR